jgi:hypothetical protein
MIDNIAYIINKETMGTVASVQIQDGICMILPKDNALYLKEQPSIKSKFHLEIRKLNDDWYRILFIKRESGA